MSWFTVTRGRLEYRGRVTKPPFTAWCATSAGRKAIARTAATIRFSIVGRARSAQRRLWRSLDAVSRTDVFARMLAGEPDRYLKILADACYADALPRLQVGLRRLVLTPRAFVTGRAKVDVANRLRLSAVLAPLDPDVREFVLERIVADMDAAVRAASPSPKRPVTACDGWVCVGVRLGTVWLDPLWAGPDATGDVFMYERPPQGLTRRDWKTLGAAMEQMSAAAASLSHDARDVMLRAASVRRA